jgi:hypothetical protein
MKTDLLIDEKLQDEFAELSGDFNPLHTDHEFSRRSTFGSPVVHGIHLLLTALEQINFDATQRITHLEVEFRSAVLVGDSFSVEIIEINSIKKILLTSKNKLCAVFQVKTEQTTPGEPLAFLAYEPLKCTENFTLNNALSTHGVDSGVVSALGIKKLFPNISLYLLHSDIDLLLMMTRTIGMKCPGSRALFRSFHWNHLPNQNQEAKIYRVSKIDRRFDLIEIEFMANSIVAKALVKIRQAPAHQPSSEYIQNFVSSNEFVGVRGLVIGGSRGLGELTVRILSCGGADVLFTYLKGESDSKRLASSLSEKVNCRFFDAQNPDEESMKNLLLFRPTHLFYFATPSIQRQFAKEFNEGLYQDFRTIFLDGFKFLCTQLNLSSAMFPSTAFIDTKETGFDEYIQAKLDGEKFCETLNQSSKCFVVYDRLPPLVTDQTSALLGSDTDSNVEVLIPLIRRTVNSNSFNS